MWISTEVLALLIEVTGNPWILLARLWNDEGCRILCAWEIDIKTDGILCLCTFMGMCVCAFVWEKTAPVLVPLKEMCAHTIFEIIVWVLITPPPPPIMSGEGDWNHHVHLSMCSGFAQKISSVLLGFFSYSAWYDGAPVIMSQSAVQSELRQFSVKLSSSSSVPVVAPHIAFALLLMWIAIPVTVQYSYAGRCALWRLYIGYGSRGCCSRSSRLLVSAEGIHSAGFCRGNSQRWFLRREFTAFSVKQLACSCCLVIMPNIAFGFAVVDVNIHSRCCTIC